jgi:hypothetical protein
VTEENATRSALELFNEKAERLLQSSLVASLLDPNTGVKISGERQADGSFELSTHLKGPSQEAIDAFVLTFRFFIQDNETMSLRNIAEVYRESGLDQEFLDRLESARSATNRLLDSDNLFNITFNESTPSNRDVMEAFIYGGLAHANAEKRRLLSEWLGFPPTSALFTACFTSVLGHVLSAIAYIANLNREALSVISASENGAS